ncbi:MAG: acyltransferase [Chlorobium sp.]|nr:MAG: acyltransferase [Chlorobium sp.]
MFKIINKIYHLLPKTDIRYLFYERYSFFSGNLSIEISKAFYGKRLIIYPHYSVWGNIRFLIFGTGSITIGKNFHAVSSRKRSFITLFSPCQLTVIGDAQIVFGEHVGLNETTITARKKVSIGDNTMIGPNTIIVDHDGHAAWPPGERWTNSGAVSEVIIENDVWIGMNCLILKGVRIGAGSIIAAGSVVIADVDPASLYAGNPAKKIKSLVL